MIGSIIDYDPNITSYKSEINRVVNEHYLEFLMLRNWSFNQTEVDVYTVPDLTVTGLSTTSTTAGTKNIAITGVGESTLGRIKDWTRLLKIEDKDFMKDTDASYKLSIKFTDFYKKKSQFHYPFGPPRS